MPVLSKAKIDNFGLNFGLMFEDHDILKFEISMHKILAVNIFEANKEFSHDLSCLTNIENTTHFKIGIKGLTEEFHDNVDGVF